MSALSESLVFGFDFELVLGSGLWALGSGLGWDRSGLELLIFSHTFNENWKLVTS